MPNPLGRVFRRRPALDPAQAGWAAAAGTIAAAIEQSASGHLHGRDCTPDGCTTCARARQAEADAELARKIGRTT